MWNLPGDDPLAVACVQAIRSGDLATLEALLREHAGLAEARVAGARTLLHIATDWPGHYPNSAETIALLIAYGADGNARFHGKHTETPLHWAASNDDVASLDALLDRGADIEAPGAVIGGGTPLADAVAFGQWQTARRLVERGARANFWQAAALGLMTRLEDEITNAFWCACHGGQREAAEYLLARGASLNWVGYDGKTPLDAAERSGAHELAHWLRDRGAKSAKELT